MAGMASPARGQNPVHPLDNATPYCEGNGGPAGMATDAEHEVLLGDPPLPAAFAAAG